MNGIEETLRASGVEAVDLTIRLPVDVYARISASAGSRGESVERWLLAAVNNRLKQEGDA